MKHLLNACVALGALLALQPATAGPPRDISAEIAAQRTDFVSARVYHLPDSISNRIAFEEKQVAEGCSYAASNDDLAVLLAMLIGGEIHETGPTPYGFEVRTIVYLAKHDGSTVPLLLTLGSPASRSHGSYDRSVPVEASAAFSTTLHAWMATRTATDPVTSKPCIELHHID